MGYWLWIIGYGLLVMDYWLWIIGSWNYPESIQLIWTANLPFPENMGQKKAIRFGMAEVGFTGRNLLVVEGSEPSTTLGIDNDIKFVFFGSGSYGVKTQRDIEG